MANHDDCEYRGDKILYAPHRLDECLGGLGGGYGLRLIYLVGQWEGLMQHSRVLLGKVTPMTYKLLSMHILFTYPLEVCFPGLVILYMSECDRKNPAVGRSLTFNSLEGVRFLQMLGNVYDQA